jgi:multidrug efflux pump subunit AcrA (membrane-fusion protein)
VKKLVLLCALAAAACKGRAQQGAQQGEGVPVTVAQVERKNVPQQVTAIGTVEPMQTVTVRSQVGGTLVGVHFREGQEVKRGDLLFTIDPRPYQAALAQARDATAEMALGLRLRDDEVVERLLPEWRGALFRVRLARLRALEHFNVADRVVLARHDREEPGESPTAGLAAVVASVLVLVGALLFTAGAVLAAWPLWAAGLALFAGGFLVARP